MPAAIRTEVRHAVLEAIASGKTPTEAAASAGVSVTTTLALARQARALVDYAELRETVVALVTDYLVQAAAALSVQARILADEQWLRETQGAGAFQLAQANRVLGDQLLRYLSAFRASAPPGAVGEDHQGETTD